MPAITLRPIEFEATSETTAGLTYTVRLSLCGCCDTCTCPDYRRRAALHPKPKGCKHIRAARTLAAWVAKVQQPAAPTEFRDTLPPERNVTKALTPGGSRAARFGACPCVCNSGGFCGGCGHAGCGRRSR